MTALPNVLTPPRHLFLPRHDGLSRHKRWFDGRWWRKLIGVMMAGEVWVDDNGKFLIDDDGKTLVCDDCPCSGCPNACRLGPEIMVNIAGVDASMCTDCVNYNSTLVPTEPNRKMASLNVDGTYLVSYTNTVYSGEAGICGYRQDYDDPSPGGWGTQTKHALNSCAIPAQFTIDLNLLQITIGIDGEHNRVFRVTIQIREIPTVTLPAAGALVFEYNDEYVEECWEEALSEECEDILACYKAKADSGRGIAIGSPVPNQNICNPAIKHYGSSGGTVTVTLP